MKQYPCLSDETVAAAAALLDDAVATAPEWATHATIDPYKIGEAHTPSVYFHEGEVNPAKHPQLMIRALTESEREAVSLRGLIVRACDGYRVSALLRESALTLDPRALKQLGTLAGNRAAILPPLDLHEVTKWGVSWETSRYAVLRSLAR